MTDRRPRPAWRRATQAGLAVLVATMAFIALVALGYISRAKTRAPSPDGRLEAVCRGWLPEPTEYGVWLRRRWQPRGTYVAHTGTESMGRCRTLLWSPDGQLVVVVNEGNTLVVLDAEARRVVGRHARVVPGGGWDYASDRVITAARFVSVDELALEHCERVHRPGYGGHLPICGGDRRTHLTRLVRTSAGVSISGVDESRDVR